MRKKIEIDGVGVVGRARTKSVWLSCVCSGEMPSGSCNAGTCQYDGVIIPPTAELIALMNPSNQTGSGAQRGKCGYHYYHSKVIDLVKQTLAAKRGGAPPSRSDVSAEVSRKWHALSDAKRNAWNDYAKSKNAQGY